MTLDRAFKRIALDADAVFFDAGFTLLDSVRDVADVYHERAVKLGAIVDENKFRDRMASLWSRLNQEYRSKYPDFRSSEEIERDAWRQFTFEIARPFPSLAKLHQHWLDSLVSYFDHPSACGPTEHAVDLVAGLARSGVAVAVLSNWHSAVDGILDHHGLARHCRFVLTSAEAGHKKPHPEIFTIALDRLRVPAHRAIHVGDSWDEDVQGAINAGIRAIHFDRSNTLSNTSPGNVSVIASLSELLS